MSKSKDQSVEAMLKREQRKNRIKTTVMIAAASMLIGVFIGYFQSINIITDVQHQAIQALTSK